MIALIAICYASLYLLLFNKLGVLKKTPGNVSAFAGVGVVLIAVVVFMWYTFAPMSSDARMFRYIIPIVPNVKGEVVAVPVEGNSAVRRGETLFQIDPEPFEIRVRQLRAQIAQHEADLRLAEINLARAGDLLRVQAAAQVDLDIWTANKDKALAAIDSAQAQLDQANWQLEQTTVKAPHEGYVLNLQLRPGAVVSSIPAASPMAFVSNERNPVLASFSQSAVRKVAVGDEVEVAFTSVPGQIFSGKVERIVAFGGDSQLSASSRLPSLTGAPVDDRWMVVVALDDEAFARQLPQGSGGRLAVYTRFGKPLHMISKVTLRMSAWLAYLTVP